MNPSASEPVCGWCGRIITGECAFDTRALRPEGARVCHPECIAPFRAAMVRKREQATAAVLRAVIQAINAYHAYGPVGDGRPEGVEFERRLDELASAATAAGLWIATRKKRKKPHGRKS